MGGSSATSTYDQTISNLIDASNVAGAVISTDYPRIFRNANHAIIRTQVYSDASTETKADLTDVVTFAAKIGSRGDAALIENTDSPSFNDLDDWADANVASGAICFAVDTSGAGVDTALAQLDSKRYSCHIIGTDIAGDDFTIAQYYLTLTNTPD
jgi:hypothetical protein